MKKRFFHLQFFAMTMIALALVAGCSSQKQVSTNAPRTLSAEEKRVVEIAREAVAKNDSWVERAEFERPQRQADGKWSVMVWRLPKVPGGYRTIIIDGKGNVTEYFRGL